MLPDDRIAFRVGSAPAAPGIRGESNTAVAIPDNDPAGITSTIQIAETGRLTRLTVKLDLTHTYIGDLVVALASPGGQVVTLHNGPAAAPTT